MRLTAKLQKTFFLSVFALSISACGNDVSQEPANQEAPQENTQVQTNSNKTMSIARQELNKNKMTANMMIMKGQIVYQTMEGGFYSFIADNGDKYTPMQLPKTHKRNGLIVEIEAEELHDVMTTMQFGKVIKIHNVKVLDETQVTEIKENM